MKERKWIESIRHLLVALVENVEEDGLLFRNLEAEKRVIPWFNINSGELKNICRINFHKFLIGLTGKHAWQQEEERKGDISTALMFQEQMFISELFKEIQDANLLILHYTTIWKFRADSSIIFAILDVRV